MFVGEAMAVSFANPTTLRRPGDELHFSRQQGEFPKPI